MKSVDPLLARTYNDQSYHCVHFVIEAGKHLFELDYSKHFLGFTGSLNKSLRAEKQNFVQAKRLQRPVDGCVVMMTSFLNRSHVGIYYDNRVLHLTEMGVHFQEMRAIKRLYSRLRYYEATNL